MTRLKTLAVVLAVLTASALGCHKPPADSPEFQSAFQLYNQLYAASLDDAYGDPRMQQVLDLLQKVDPASGQASEAKDLQAKVEAGMSDARKRAERVAAAQKDADAPLKIDRAPVELPALNKAPVTLATGPSLGMTRDQFTSQFGDCFDRRGDYEQGEKKGEAFGLLPACAQRFPAFSTSIVVLLDNRVAALVPLKDVTVKIVDAGQAAALPALPLPAPVAAPAPPEPVRYYPGAPHPSPAGAAAPAAP